MYITLYYILISYIHTIYLYLIYIIYLLCSVTYPNIFNGRGYNIKKSYVYVSKYYFNFIKIICVPLCVLHSNDYL